MHSDIRVSIISKHSHLIHASATMIHPYHIRSQKSTQGAVYSHLARIHLIILVSYQIGKNQVHGTWFHMLISLSRILLIQAIALMNIKTHPLVHITSRIRTLNKPIKMRLNLRVTKRNTSLLLLATKFILRLKLLRSKRRYHRNKVTSLFKSSRSRIKVNNSRRHTKKFRIHQKLNEMADCKRYLKELKKSSIESEDPLRASFQINLEKKEKSLRKDPSSEL